MTDGDGHCGEDKGGLGVEEWGVFYMVLREGQTEK